MGALFVSRYGVRVNNDTLHICQDGFMICANILKVVQDVFQVLVDGHFIGRNGFRVGADLCNIVSDVVKVLVNGKLTR